MKAAMGVLRPVVSKFGRKPKLTAHQIREALARKAQGEALTEIGRTFGVSHSTISRLRKERVPVHDMNL
jgi:hypothetical protein